MLPSELGLAISIKLDSYFDFVYFFSWIIFSLVLACICAATIHTSLPFLLPPCCGRSFSIFMTSELCSHWATAPTKDNSFNSCQQGLTLSFIGVLTTESSYSYQRKLHTRHLTTRLTLICATAKPPGFILVIMPHYFTAHNDSNAQRRAFVLGKHQALNLSSPGICATHHNDRWKWII